MEGWRPIERAAAALGESPLVLMPMAIFSRISGVNLVGRPTGRRGVVVAAVLLSGAGVWFMRAIVLVGFARFRAQPSLADFRRL